MNSGSHTGFKIGSLAFHGTTLLLLALVCMGCNRTIQPDREDKSTNQSNLESGKQSVDDKKTGKRPAPAEPDFQFQDIALKSGVNFTPGNGMEAKEFTMLETLGTGVALFDMDQDGWLDLFLPGGGTIENKQQRSLPWGLYRNLGDEKFADVTSVATTGEAKYYSHGAVVGDYDNDGFEDLLVTGYGGIQFLRNQGDGSFLETELAGVDEVLWSTGGAWADFNGDQHPDLFVAHYLDWSWDNNIVCGPETERNVCPPRRFKGLDDSLYFSKGDGTFTPAGSEHGLVSKGKGLGVLACDPDQDHDIDIYVGNDTDENFYYLNDGTGHFQEIARDRGVDVGADGTPNGSMGISLCDYDNNQSFDFWVTNFEAESFALYKGHQDGFYQHASLVSGITRLGATLVGWGTAWCDFDFDGDQDVVIANGHILYDARSQAMPQRTVLMENQGGRMNAVRFGESSYFSHNHLGRGLATGDLDNDGDPDVAIANLNEPVALLRNDSTRKGTWVKIRLIGRQSNRLAVGATLELNTSKETYLRQITAGGSYISASDRHVFYAVPNGEQFEKLTIKWPSGMVQTLTDIGLKRTITIIEPQQN